MIITWVSLHLFPPFSTIPFGDWWEEWH
jgi:hypothetical protein